MVKRTTINEKVLDVDLDLVKLAEAFLIKHYRPKRHHVATALLGGSGKIYYAVHIDSNGFDVCAEPIALENAFMAGETEFKSIVSVIKKDNRVEVVNPCGNCRQILFEYCPNIEVLLNDNGKISKTTAKKLLPFPYLHR